MPCPDIGELVRVSLDNGERLTGYSLQKRTCDKAVGQLSLIGEYLYGQTAGEILELDVEEFLTGISSQNETERYLIMKHFLAIQSVLEIFFGRLSGSKRNYCTVESIDYGSDNVEILAHLEVNVPTAKIERCLSCSATE